MYSEQHLRRVQDYILRGPDLAYYVFRNTNSPEPGLVGADITHRKSPYVQAGSLLVLDKDGVHQDVVGHLMGEPGNVSSLGMGQAALFQDEL